MPQAALLSILKQAQSYVFQLQPPGSRHSAAVLLTSLPQAAEQGLRDQVEKMAQLLNDLIVHRRSPGPVDDVVPPDPLLGLGRLIYNQLFPPVIQLALQDIPAGSPLIIATNDPELPWELAHDDEDYLALKHVVARQMLAHEPPRQNVVRRGRLWTSLLIGNPTGDLPEANEEIEQLIRLIEAIPGTAPPRIRMRSRATKEAVLQELASGAYDLIHYSGHATFDPQHPDANGILLAGDEVLTAAEIQKNLGGQPVVFLNACESARGSAGRGEAEGLAYLGLAAQGLASAFIQGSARGFVGTFWPVHDASSRDFALAFYRSALPGEAIGEALRVARTGARQAGPMDPLWASFVLYGDPRIPLLTVKQTERRPATVLTARLLGLETLFEDIHGEVAAGVVETYVAALAAQIAHHGGQVHSLAHDTLIGTFGIPTTHQNDAERAVRAALGMGEAVDQLRQAYSGRSLGLGLGLSSGDVFLGDAGDGDQMVPTVTGEVVNQAVWLAGQADDGTILIAESVQRLTGHLFDTSTWLSAGPTPRSLADPHGSGALTAYQVLGLRPEPSPPWRRHEPLDELGTGFVEGEIPGRQTAVIGRERELAMLHEAWQMCRQGRGQIVGVEGEAGVGKSRLLYEFRKSLGDEDVRWLTATCPSAYSPGPYALVAQLLHAFFGLAPTQGGIGGPLPPNPPLPTLGEGGTGLPVPTSPPELGGIKGGQGKLRATLQRLLGDDSPEQELLESLAILGDILVIPFPEVSLAHLDPKGRQRRLVNILGRLLAQKASKTPLIVALEDLHWVDDASLEVLSQLVVGIGQLPILVITLFRSEAEWQPPWWQRRNYRPVRLDTLDEVGSRALLAMLLNTNEAPEDIAGVVLPRAGGNPFFMRELVASLQESGALRRRNGKWRLARPLDVAEVPGTLQRVILTRIEGLPKAAQQVLPIAAVAGDDFELPVLGAVAAETGDESILDDGLAQLAEREFIYRRWGEEVYHFTHALIQEVAYESLLIEERRRYHRRLGRAMEQIYAGREAEVLELLAHHFYRSVMVPGAPGAPEAVIGEADAADLTRAADYLSHAGGRANHQYAARQAIAHYKRALKVAGHLPADVEGRLAECHAGLGDAHNLLGDFDPAIEAYEAAFAELTAGPMKSEERRRAADLARRIGRLHGWQARYDEALRWMEKGLQALGERLDDDSRATAAMVHIHTGTIYYYRGQYDEAAAYIQRGLGIVEGTEHVTPMAEGYNLLGAVHDAKGERKQAVVYYEKSLSLWGKLDDAYQMARVEDNVGIVYFHLGRWEEAAESHRRALAFFERIEDRDQMTYACLNLGNVHLCRGEWDLAEGLFERARALSEEVGNLRMLALSHINLGLVSLEREDWVTARHHLEHSRGLLEGHGIEDFLAETYAALGKLYLGEGDAAAALNWGRKALDAAQALEMRLEEGQAHRVLGMAYQAQGDLARSEEYLRRSLSALESVGHRYEVGRTLVQLARVCRDAGRVDESQDHLNRAVAIFEELGAQADLREVRLSASQRI